MRVHDYAAGAPGIELKGDNDDPNEVVTKALADLTASVEGRAGEVKAIGERLDKLEAKMNRPGVAGDKKDDPDAAAEKKAFAEYLHRGDRAVDIKTLRVAVDPQGGVLAPAEMSAEMIRNLVEFSPIRTLASVRSTSSPSVQYPKRTGVTNAGWRAELQDATASEPSFGMVEVPVHELATYVDISNELLADSAGMAETEVRQALAEDFGKKEGLAFISGSGIGQPLGLLTAAGIAYTFSGNASTLGSAPADLLITAMYALPAAYRNRGMWVMNGNTIAAVRKLKDGTTGNYLWQPAYTAGQPETILGRPVVEAVDMPDIGSAAEPIIFGDFDAAYRIVDRLALSILVNPYLLATKGVTRIHATRRVGATVIRPEAIRKIRCATS
jgi:HK97 family phage major capsid protein